MHLQYEHKWDVSPAEAKQIQLELAEKVLLADDFGEIRTVAGVDVGFEDKGKTVRAAVAVLDFKTLKPVEDAIARIPTHMPYVPGYLSFREVPGVLKALEKLAALPDLLLCDGQGYAHPRRFGIACHLGVLTNIPAIGIAKSRLIGTYDMLGPDKGDMVDLTDHSERIGHVVRTRTNVKPLFISPGHRISFDSASAFLMSCITKYRLPETTRRAHNLASVK